MTSRTRTAFAVAALAFLVFMAAAGLSAADGVVIKARKIYTAADGIIENGVIFVQDGKIVYVGNSAPPVPAGTRELRADVVLPGLVDIHSHLGVYSAPDVTENQDGNEMTTPLTPQVRALDSFNFEDPALEAALAGGVTTIVSRPGSGNVIGGTSVAVKLKCSTPTRMVLKENCDLKMTIEGNPVAFHGSQNRMPMTLMAVYFLARKSFIEARDYMDAWDRYEKDKASGKDVPAPKRDLGKEPLVMALKREIPVHIHTCTASEIMSCIRLAEEFNLRLTMAHCDFAFLLTDELRNRRDIHFNVGPAWFTTYYDDPSKIRNVAAILAEAGLNVSLQVDAGMGRQPAQQYLLHAADLCVRHGMSEEDALKAITIRGAEAAGLEDRVGSIEKGKDADFVFLDGEPFEWLTSVESVMIDGRVEYTRAAEEKPLQASSIPPPASPLVVPAGIDAAAGYAIKGGTLLTMAGPRIDNGTVLVRNGKIEAVGKDIRIPAGWPVIDAGGRVVMPGLVSPRSQVGISMNWRFQESVDELSKPVVPEMEVKNAIEPQDILFPAARTVGLTTIQVTPGDMNAVGGQGVVIKTAGAVVDRMVVKDRSVMVFGLGAMAKRKNQMPSTRMGIAALLRENLLAAREYGDRLARYEKEGQGARPSRDFTLEALVPVVRGDMPVMIHCERQDDILTALRIADEFHLKVILTGGAEAHKAAAEIRKRNIPVIIDKIFRAGGNTEDSDFDPANLSILAKAGIKVSFTLGDYLAWYIPLGLVGADPLEVAAFAFKNGLSEDQALEAVTIEAARIIGCEGRIGSLEPGKDADILILSGHPFLTRSAPEAVFIDGKPVYRKTKGENL
jgi:imidazolonepropionase-like amidohydrolase